MSASVIRPFPLVQLHAVMNARHKWVALQLRWSPAANDTGAALRMLFDDPELFGTLAPLDCVLPVPDVGMLDDALLALLPVGRTIFSVPAAAVADPQAQQQCLRLQQLGYRLLQDGVSSASGGSGAGHALALDCGEGMSPSLAPLPPGAVHLARGVDSAALFLDCQGKGFSWFCGQYPLHPEPSTTPDDGTSRTRLLALLGLLARDAESRELEGLLKQDPALSFHLLKLVNSAAFAQTTPISNFSQAISVLGRRQLQRWLQLLLYARPGLDGAANPLLPLAALRAAQMETLCRLQGGIRAQQDSAFMTGVFSLLDVLLVTPMHKLVGSLSLAPEVADALLERRGPLGALLALAEASSADEALLAAADIDARAYWRSLVQAYHWAIHVSRNL